MSEAVRSRRLEPVRAAYALPPAGAEVNEALRVLAVLASLWEPT